MKLRRTNYYLPGFNSEIVLTDDPTTLNGRIIFLGNEEDALFSSLIGVGFASWIKQNRLYRQLIECVGISEMTNADMLNFLMHPEASLENEFFQYHHQPYPSRKQEGFDKEIIEKVVQLRLEQKWSVSSLRAKFGLNQSQISEIFKTI